MVLPFMLLALLGYAVLAWFRPTLAVACVLALLPTYLVRFTVAGVPMTLLEGMLLIGAGIILLRWRLADAGTFHASPFAEPLVPLAIAWVAIGFLAALWSPAEWRAWGSWKAYFLEPVVWWFALRALRDRLDIERHVLWPLAVGAAGISLYAIVQHWTGFGIPPTWADVARRRVTSVFGYPNAVGLYLGPIVPLLVGLAYASRRAVWLRMLAGGIALLAVAAIIFARSTGALIAVFVALGSMGAFWWWARTPAVPGRRAWLVVGAFLAASALCTLWLPYQRNLERIAHPVARKLAFGAWSGSVRLAQYRETWAFLRDHPVRGAGLSGYPTAIAPYHRDAKVEIFLDPHHLLLAFAVEVGVVGAVLFLVMMVRVLRLLFPHRASVVQISVAAAFVTMLVHGLVDVPYLKNDLSVLWWTLAAIAVLASGPRSPGHVVDAS